MKAIVVLASVIIALIVLSLFIVASYGQYHYHAGHHAIPIYVQPAPIQTALIPTYASYPPQFTHHETYIPAPSHHIPSYQPIMAASIPAPTMVPITPVIIPQYNQPAQPPPQPQIQERSSSPSRSEKPTGFSFGKSLTIPNDIADKLFPFTIRIASHGEPHMPVVKVGHSPFTLGAGLWGKPQLNYGKHIHHHPHSLPPNPMGW